MSGGVAMFLGGWRPITEAPTDGTVVWVRTIAYDGLPPVEGEAAYHPDAGWCVDELRVAVAFREIVQVRATQWPHGFTWKATEGTEDKIVEDNGKVEQASAIAELRPPPQHEGKLYHWLADGADPEPLLFMWQAGEWWECGEALPTSAADLASLEYRYVGPVPTHAASNVVCTTDVAWLKAEIRARDTLIAMQSKQIDWHDKELALRAVTIEGKDAEITRLRGLLLDLVNNDIKPVDIFSCRRETETGQVLYRYKCRLKDAWVVNIVVPHDPVMSVDDGQAKYQAGHSPISPRRSRDVFFGVGQANCEPADPSPTPPPTPTTTTHAKPLPGQAMRGGVTVCAREERKMALSNILREPRREITESLVGIGVFVGFVLADYEVASWVASGWPANERVVDTVFLMFMGIPTTIGGVGLLFLTHFIGESICNGLEKRGVQLRPVQRPVQRPVRLS